METFGYVLRSGTVGAYGNSRFHFLRSLCVDFQNGYMMLYSPQEWITFPLFPHLCQHFLSSFFFLGGIRSNCGEKGSWRSLDLHFCVYQCFPTEGCSPSTGEDQAHRYTRGSAPRTPVFFIHKVRGHTSWLLNLLGLLELILWEV